MNRTQETIITSASLGLSAWLLAPNALVALGASRMAALDLSTPIALIVGLSGAYVVAWPVLRTPFAHWARRWVHEAGAGIESLLSAVKVQASRLTLLTTLPFDGRNYQATATTQQAGLGQTTMHTATKHTTNTQRPAQRRAGPVKGAVSESLPQRLQREVATINRTFDAFDLSVGVRPTDIFVCGNQLVIYRLSRADSQKIDKIDKSLDELSDALSNLRREKTLVRLQRHPLRLEVEHPHFAPLVWRESALDGQPHTALIGREYGIGTATNRDIDFGNTTTAHVLVSGTTGSGKSILLANMLLSLAWRTAPADLRLLLVDKKNRGLVPFARLPHVDHFAIEDQDVADTVLQALATMERRVLDGTSTPRVLLVIDELASVANDKTTAAALTRINERGRELGVHVVAAIQHPTAAAIGDGGAKSNYPMRLVGVVADANAAHTATGRAGTHAELLPAERGAFLYVRSNEIVRVNSYFVDADLQAFVVRQIGKKWKASPPKQADMARYGVDTGLDMGLIRLDMGVDMARYGIDTGVDMARYTRVETRSTEKISQSEFFPVSAARTLSADEAAAVRELAATGQFDYRGTLSISRLTQHVYGSRNPQREQFVKDALGANHV